MTIFPVYLRIANLMISCGDGERYDYQMDRSGCELCECCGARSSDGNIRSIQDMRDILLWYPVKNLRIFPSFKLTSHIPIECSKRYHPLAIGKVFFLVQKGSKNLPRTLTPTTHKDMFLIGFPVDITYWILLKKSRMENLSYDRGFFCIEPFSCFLEPEKHARRKVPENFVRESRNRI